MYICIPAGPVAEIRTHQALGEDVVRRTGLRWEERERDRARYVYIMYVYIYIYIYTHTHIHTCI